MYFGRAAVGHGDPGRRLFEQRVQVAPHLLAEKAQAAFHAAFVGNAVPRRAAVKVAHRQHRRLAGVDAARDDGVGAAEDLRGAVDRVEAEVRRGAVGALAPHLHGERLAARRAGSVDHRHRAAGKGGLHVNAEDRVDRFQFRQQGARVVAQAHLLAGLEAEDQLSPQPLLHGAQPPRRRQHARGVEVVAAHVRRAVNFGDERLGAFQVAGVFLQRQRVHVGAQRQRPARTSRVEHAQQAVAPFRRADHLQPQALQLGGDDARRARFLPAQLGMAVQVAPQRHDFIFYRNTVHRKSPSCRFGGKKRRFS